MGLGAAWTVKRTVARSVVSGATLVSASGVAVSTAATWALWPGSSERALGDSVGRNAASAWASMSALTAWRVFDGFVTSIIHCERCVPSGARKLLVSTTRAFSAARASRTSSSRMDAGLSAIARKQSHCDCVSGLSPHRYIGLARSITASCQPPGSRPLPPSVRHVACIPLPTGWSHSLTPNHVQPFVSTL